MKQITVNTAPPYGIYAERGLISKAGELIKPLTEAGKLMIVSDETVFDLYGGVFLDSLRDSGYKCGTFIIEPGERSKNGGNLLSLWETLAENGFSRSDAVVSLGGGVVSDLGGFAAASYMRGIAHVIFPTTLLSMADASVGGKTAIDLNAGKNLAGAFYTPLAVFCDTAALDTLPGDVYADGMAEIIKCGMISSPELLRFITENRSPEELIYTAVTIKKDLAEADERDVGARRLLNFGHTLAHAAETLSGGALTHGRAVAAGMYLITSAAVKRGFCVPEAADILGGLLDLYKLPKSFPFSLREVCQTAFSDKKRSGNTLTLVLPARVGKAVLHEIPADGLYDFLS